MSRIKSDKFADPERKVKYNKLMRQNADRAVKIEQIVETAPETTKHELHKALKHKKPKHKEKEKDN